MHDVICEEREKKKKNDAKPLSTIRGWRFASALRRGPPTIYVDT